MTTYVWVWEAVGGLFAAIAAWSLRSMSPQPMPSARTSMSLWSLWKSSTSTFIAARVAGLGSVSHMVTVTFFWAPAGRAPPASDSAVGARRPRRRAETRNWRRSTAPCPVLADQPS